MNKEAFFIAQFKSHRIGDDGAVIGKKVYSKDLFCEDIHFKREWLSFEQIATKSMLVNISDAIAMNATPRHALLGLVLPHSVTCNEMAALAQGFEKTAKCYGIEIIGGDTTAGEKLMVSVSIVSDVHKPLLRRNARVGDWVAYTGTLGWAYRDLTKLLRGGIVSSRSRFITPELRVMFMHKAGSFLRAGMDISDGLSKDLSRLLKESGGLDIAWERKLSKRVLCSGEEYEMLFTFSPKDKAKLKRISKQTRTKMTIIGKLKRGRYRCVCKEHHF